MCGARIYIHKGQRKIKLFHLASRFRSMNNQLGLVRQSRAVEKLPPSIQVQCLLILWALEFCVLPAYLGYSPKCNCVAPRGSHVSNRNFDNNSNFREIHKFHKNTEMNFLLQWESKRRKSPWLIIIRIFLLWQISFATLSARNYQIY